VCNLGLGFILISVPNHKVL